MQWVQIESEKDLPKKTGYYYTNIGKVAFVENEGWLTKDYSLITKWLDESTPYPLLKSVNDLLGLTGCASLEEVGLKFNRMRKKVEETSPVHGRNIY